MEKKPLPLTDRKRSGLPLYLQLADTIKKWILDEGLKNGDRLPSCRQLYRKLHTTPATLNRALNELTVQGLIQRRSGAGIFVGSGQKVEKYRIAVFTKSFANPYDSYVGQVLQGIHAFWHLKEFSLIMMPAQVRDYERLFLEYELAGATVLCPQEEHLGKIAELARNGLPLVSIGYAQPGLEGIAYGTDHEEATVKAVDYLYSLGYTKIGFFSHTDVNANIVRRRGWRKGLEKNGLPFGPDWDVQSGDFLEQTVAELLRKGNLPEAVIVTSSFLAVEFSHICRRLRIDIPCKLAVLALDDDRHTRFFDPPLTVLLQDLAAITAASQEALLLKIRGENQQGTVKSAFPVKLIERSSTLNLKLLAHKNSERI